MAEPLEIVDAGGSGAAVILRVAGRLDAKSAPALLQRCAAARAGRRHLVLNLSGVTFIASSGIGALLGLAEEFRQGRYRVRFVCLSSAVSSVIGLLNLDQFLAIDAGEEEALDELAA